MDDLTKDDPNFSLTTESLQYNKSDSFDLREVENRAWFLMQDISSSRKTLTLLLNSIRKGNEDYSHVYILQERILMLCKELESIEEKVQQAFEAMGRNLQALDTHHLSTPHADEKITRAAEIAEWEGNRLHELLTQIHKVLQRDDECDVPSSQQPFKTSFHADLQPLTYDRDRRFGIKSLLVGLENARVPRLNNRNMEDLQPSDLAAAIDNHEVSTDLSITLSKIPLEEGKVAQINSGRHGGDLLVDNTHSDSSDSDDGPYGTGDDDGTINERYDASLLSEAGFDGSYRLSVGPEDHMLSFDTEILEEE